MNNNRTDFRKKENPRNNHLGFRTDDKTLAKAIAEAKAKGVTISQHIHDKLK